MNCPFVILAGKNDIRVSEFQKALSRQSLSAAHIITYREYIRSPEVLYKTPANNNFILRIDSPGRDLKAQALITELGIPALKKANKPYESVQNITANSQEKGRIIAPNQFYYGFKHILQQIENQIDQHTDIQVMNHPFDIQLAFDKYACQRYLLANDIPIAEPFEEIHNYQQLRDAMKVKKIPRVFIKLKHGSSASGIIALETSKDRVQIKTTIETERRKNHLTLFNSRKIRQSNDEAYIESLVDILCTMEVQVERWIPKAQLSGHNVDLRILMIAGKAQHKVLRMSHTPMTNLHLLNQRAEVELLKNKMSKQAWESLIDSCEKVAKLFPKSLYIALDVVVSIGLKKHFILEVNAFGDLLKNTFYKGLSPQEAQINHFKTSHKRCNQKK